MGMWRLIVHVIGDQSNCSLLRKDFLVYYQNLKKLKGDFV